jgi:hypothetical protein
VPQRERSPWLADVRRNLHPSIHVAPRPTWIAYITERSLDQVITIRGGKRPDFLVETGRSLRFMTEVKAFETPTVLDRSVESIGAMFVGDLQKRINSGSIERAAKQLAPYAHEDFPRVVVLDNHRQIGISLGTIELIQVFGTLQYEFTIDSTTGTSISEGWSHRDSNSAMGDRQRRYISAVVVNVPTERFDAFDGTVDDFTVPRPMRVHVIHNPDAANPLPLWVFSEPDDKQIIRQGDRWIEFSSPPAQVRHSDMARRAYEIFERHGRRHGRDREDWLQAERETREQIG